MATETKTPVDVVEKFLAMQNTRKQMAERFADSGEIEQGLAGKAKSSADRAVAQLMDELSQFGDAVKGAGTEDNEFYQIANDAVAKLETLSGEQKQQALAQMEQALYKMYEKTLAEEKDLPPSIKEIMTAQAKELIQGTHQEQK